MLWCAIFMNSTYHIPIHVNWRSEIKLEKICWFVLLIVIQPNYDWRSTSSNLVSIYIVFCLCWNLDIGLGYVLLNSVISVPKMKPKCHYWLKKTHQQLNSYSFGEGRGLGVLQVYWNSINLALFKTYSCINIHSLAI